MMAVNFEQIADNKSISIQDLIPGTTEGLTGNTAAANADQIQVYDPEKESYTVYSLYYGSSCISVGLF